MEWSAGKFSPDQIFCCVHLAAGAFQYSSVDGKPSGNVTSHEVGAMSANECARRILAAAARRKRDVMSPRLRLGLVLAPILPGLIDKIAAAQYA